jgi:hypothetical protein
MKKRLSREEKWNQAVIDLINQMFIMAGHKVTYNDIKDRQDAWYMDWTMTEQQYNDWKEWGRKYLMKNLKQRSKQAEKDMMWVGLQWGLKFDKYPGT